jgi:hypothetical protein
MALGVIDFYSPVAKGFAAGFFCGDFGGKVDFWGEKQVRLCLPRIGFVGSTGSP